MKRKETLALALSTALAAVPLLLEALAAWAWLQGTLYVQKYGAAENPYAAEDAEIAGACALVLLPLCLSAAGWTAYQWFYAWKKRAQARTER